MPPRVPAVLALAGVLAGCQALRKGHTPDATPTEVAPVLPSAAADDVHSYANPAEARVAHVALALDADFARHVLSGTATLTLVATPDAHEVVLDTRALNIAAVDDGAGQALAFQLGAGDPVNGTPLTVTIGTARTIVVHYATAPDAEGLDWMAAGAVAGDPQPFLFARAGPLALRSWVPTQDSPGIRQSWEASVTVPDALTVVMSGTGKSALGAIAPGDRRRFSFRMDHPVAPDGIALAAGDLKFQSIDDGNGVWAAPALLPQAARAFADLPRVAAAAKDLYGDDGFDRLDLLVLPPGAADAVGSHPALAFVPAEAVGGDRSIADLLASIVAGGRTGALVDAATWNDAWLNDGFADYIAGRLVARAYGADRAAMDADLDWTRLRRALARVGARSPATRLHLDIAADADPRATERDLLALKGATFLRTVAAVTGQDRFDDWLKAYLDRYAFQPMTTTRLLADWRETLLKDRHRDLRRLPLARWAYQPGLPAGAAHVKAKAFLPVDAAARAFATDGAVAAIPHLAVLPAERFLDDLPRDLDPAKLGGLDAAFHWSQSPVTALRFAWLELALGDAYQPSADAAEAFVTGETRPRYLLPLYAAMMADTNWGQPLAVRLYGEARPHYDTGTRALIDPVVKWGTPLPTPSPTPPPTGKATAPTR